jgi:carboxyl-terminal processing protease
MRGPKGTKVKLTILRKGETAPLEFELTRDIIRVKAVKYQMLESNIGYVRLSSFQENSGNEVRDALQALEKDNMTGVIFDLRTNPGGSLVEAVNVASLFLPSGKVVVTTKGRDDKGSSLSTKAFAYRDTSRPLVILVDEGSASASEIVAGAVQDYSRGVIVGVTTFGKASVQSLVELRNNGAVKLTTARYYTPNGRSIQGVGIVPDVVVPKGKIVYSENHISIKESDLAGHLIGENENKQPDNATAVAAPDDDNQLQAAIQIMQGLKRYSVNAK